MFAGSIDDFGRVKNPCGDCVNGRCTMNCSGREVIPDPVESVRLAAQSEARKAAQRFVAVVDAQAAWPESTTMVQCADAKLTLKDARLLAEVLRAVDDKIVEGGGDAHGG